MELTDVLRKRSSIRAFTGAPIDDDVLRRVLDVAREAPSWSNTQPYLLALANGARCDALRRDMLEAVDTRAPEPDHSLLVEYPTPLKERRQATGFGLYAALGIGREDREARGAQFRKNYAFFDAPAVAFMFAHEALGVWSVLDAGIYLQTLLLAATNEGLGTCAQAALAAFPDVVRKHFDVPERYKLLCGIAIGYVDESAPENKFRPARLNVDDMLIKTRSG